MTLGSIYHLYLCLVFSNFQYFEYFSPQINIRSIQTCPESPAIVNLAASRNFPILPHLPPLQIPNSAPPNPAALNYPLFTPFAAPPDPFTGRRLLGSRSDIAAAPGRSSAAAPLPSPAPGKSTSRGRTHPGKSTSCGLSLGGKRGGRRRGLGGERGGRRRKPSPTPSSLPLVYSYAT